MGVHVPIRGRDPVVVTARPGLGREVVFVGSSVMIEAEMVTSLDGLPK